MLNKLDPIKKNKLLLPFFVVGLLLCWFLAFNKSFDAVQLNRKLKMESEKGNDISFNPDYVQQKLAALDLILKSYKVKDEWHDQLWMQSSSIAAKQNVTVDFTLDKPAIDRDSSSLKDSIRMQSLYFYGGFIQLVKLMDTLERDRGIGKISALQIKVPKVDRVGDKEKTCVLRLDFRGMSTE